MAVNLLPLLGVLFWGWDLFLLLMLYWMESAVIGFWHILRLGLETRWFALFLVPFFTVHFGGFMAGHFVFLGALFGGPRWAPIRTVELFFQEVVLTAGLWIPLAALFVSHGVSFYRNYRVSDLSTPLMVKLRDPKAFAPLMTAPYQRIVIMHLTIILGGMLSMILHNPAAAFVLMVLLKIGADLGAHVRKNFKAGAFGEAS